MLYQEDEIAEMCKKISAYNPYQYVEEFFDTYKSKIVTYLEKLLIPEVLFPEDDTNWTRRDKIFQKYMQRMFKKYIICSSKRNIIKNCCSVKSVTGFDDWKVAIPIPCEIGADVRVWMGCNYTFCVEIVLTENHIDVTLLCRLHPDFNSVQGTVPTEESLCVIRDNVAILINQIIAYYNDRGQQIIAAKERDRTLLKKSLVSILKTKNIDLDFEIIDEQGTDSYAIRCDYTNVYSFPQSIDTTSLKEIADDIESIFKLKDKGWKINTLG